MEIQNVANSQNFEGKLVILNDLSCKPHANINKVKNNLQKQIELKKYNLYMRQDYIANKIRIAASYFEPRYIQGVLTHEELPITAKSSRYIYAAKKAIENFDKSILDKEQREWELTRKQQTVEDIKGTIGTIFCFPLFVINDLLHEISPKSSKKFEKLIDKII